MVVCDLDLLVVFAPLGPALEIQWRKSLEVYLVGFSGVTFVYYSHFEIVFEGHEEFSLEENLAYFGLRIGIIRIGEFGEVLVKLLPFYEELFPYFSRVVGSDFCVYIPQVDFSASIARESLEAGFNQDLPGAHSHQFYVLLAQSSSFQYLECVIFQFLDFGVSEIFDGLDILNPIRKSTLLFAFKNDLNGLIESFHIMGAYAKLLHHFRAFKIADLLFLKTEGVDRVKVEFHNVLNVCVPVLLAAQVKIVGNLFK